MSNRIKRNIDEEIAPPRLELEDIARQEQVYRDEMIMGTSLTLSARSVLLIPKVHWVKLNDKFPISGSV